MLPSLVCGCVVIHWQCTRVFNGLAGLIQYCIHTLNSGICVSRLLHSGGGGGVYIPSLMVPSLNQQTATTCTLGCVTFPE